MHQESEYSPAETGEYLRIVSNFQDCVGCEKDLKDNKYNTLYLAENILSLYIISSSYSKQIISADKYHSIFSRQMVGIVYVYYNN